MALQLRYPTEADFSSRAPLSDLPPFPTSPSGPSKLPVTAVFRWSPQVRASLKYQKETRLTTKDLVIATGQHAHNIMQRVVENTPEARVLGTLILSSAHIVESSLSAFDPSAVCSIVSLSNDKVVVVAPLDVADEDVWIWTESLFAHIEPQRVISVSTLMSVTYDSELHETCSLRMLQTSASFAEQIAHNIPILASPRFVMGIPAALLTYSELRHLQCTVYVTLHHTSSTMSQIAASFGSITPLLQAESTKKHEGFSVMDVSFANKYEDLYS
ncbi:hypothetical protein H310_07418 [Aphanomyces invadans]|uniref:Proteasome assembly chaperone 1 n=1 Tax=Aphanomyces invadans TaxID=157072 RepID=A0A024U0N6_9STRA|nr:hypothetical protein H310_07418 [Aphanomyces invadans]ETV99965.1 hypothetical protein H310_07418 [Aphanomyces invadans]|eukprot:XP_008871383.1 hypothetical protein H310_07418 [Aphanomyces invadans]